MKSYLRNLILFVYVFLLYCGASPRDLALSILKEGIKDKSEIIQVNAAKAVLEIGEKNGYEVIYNTLQNGSNDAKVSALVALYSLKEKAYSPVIAKLCKDSEPLIRTEAYHLISLSTDTGYYKILVQGTRDRIARVRRYAYQGLANFKDIQNITQGLRDIDPLVRISAAKSLGLLSRPEAKDFIKNEMDPRNPNVEIWAQAVLALGELKDTSAIQYIKDLLTDTPWDLKIAAAEALLMLKDNSGVDILKSGLQSPDPFVRVKAVEVMERHPLPAFYELLKEACRDEYINVSIGAINALMKYQKKENLKLFESLLKAPNPLVRITSASAYLRSL